MLSWALLVLGGLLLVAALRNLAEDAASGVEVSMGAAMLFGGQWLAGSVLLAAGASRLLGLGWMSGAVLALAVYLLRGAVASGVRTRYRGRDLAAPPAVQAGSGFARLDARARELGEERPGK